MKVITFYSYKGGVGRSLALANVATRLAEFERHVCLLDFDLEAPGLHYKFSNALENQGITIQSGIVDYIYQYTNEGVLANSLAEYCYSFPASKGSFYITMLPAGNVDSNNYWKKLSSINWHDFLYGNDNGLSFLISLKEKIRRELNPDYLLIDSRTGVTEISGIALSLLADEVVVLAANNNENLDGAKKIMKSISDPANRIIGSSPKITFVLCRVPFTSEATDRAKEQRLIDNIRNKFDGLVDDIKVIHSDRDLEEKEEIKIGYEKDETVAQISRDYLNLFESLTINDLTESEKNNFKVIREAEQLFKKAVAEPIMDLKLKYLEKAIGLNKSRTDFLIYQASIYEKLFQWANVIKSCDAILSSDTRNLKAFEMKGNAELQMKRYEDAKNTFLQALEFNESRASAKLGLARIAIYYKEYDRALTYYNEILLADPQNVAAISERADIKRMMKNYLSALDDIYKALEIDPTYARAFLILAKINAGVDNMHEFFLNLENALRSDKKVIEIDVNLYGENIYKDISDDQRFLKIADRYDVSSDILKND